MFRLLPILAFCGSALVAQGAQFVVPAGQGYATQVGEGRLVGAFESGSARETTVYERGSLGFGTATIVELAWRRPAGSDPISGHSTSLTARLAQTLAPPATMSYRFSGVLGATPSVVFQGPLALPGAPPGAGPHPFALVLPLAAPFSFDPARGNLVVDLEAQNPFPATWPRDARDVRGGVPGSFRTLTPPCMNSTGFAMTQSPTALDNLAPGRILQVRVTGTLPTSPTVLHWVGPALASPLDLAAIGAPGCRFAVEPAVVMPPVAVYPATSVFGWAWAEHAVPALPSLVGARLGSQWAELDAPAGNSLGVVFSDAIEMTLGDATGPAILTKTLRSTSPGVEVGQLLVGDRGAIVRIGVR